MKSLLSVIGLSLLPFTFLYGQQKFDLKESLLTARQNNLILKSQKLNIGLAKSDVVTAGLRPNPILNNQTLQLGSSRYFPMNSNWNNGVNRQIWWQLTKNVQWPGQRPLKIQTSNYQVSLSEKEFAETERKLFFDVAMKWLDVWYAQKQLDILSIAKSNADSVTLINQYRYHKQVITETDYLRTQLLSKQLTLEIKVAQQGYLNELKNLKILLGVQDTIAIDSSDAFNYELSPLLDSLILQASTSRADIQAAKSYIDWNHSNIKLQRKLAYPSPDLGVIVNPQNTIPYYGVFATMPLPVFSRNQGERKKSYFLKDQAEFNYNFLRTQVVTQVENSYYISETLKRNLDGFQEILHQSQKILNNVQYSYMRGGTTIIDFLEAQRSWLDTRQKYYETLYKYKQSYVQLMYDTGYINQMAL